MLIFILTTLAVITFISSIVIAVYNYRFKKEESLKIKLILPILNLFLSVFLFRLTYIIHGASDFFGNSNKNVLECIFYSFTHSLQTFSMDEDYDAIYSALHAFWSVNYGVVIDKILSVLLIFQNALAPLAGGAFLLDILFDFIPRLRLSLYQVLKKDDVFIFSELNEKVVVIIENIRIKFPKALIVISDTYVDEADEIRSEYLEKVKKYKAIYLRDDIMKLHIYGKRRTEYYLLDENDELNMATLTNLNSQIRPVYTTEEKRALSAGYNRYPYFEKMWKKSENVYIYLFTNKTELEIMGEKLNRYFDFIDLKQTTVRIINEYTNLVYDLLEEHPLYSAVDIEQGCLNLLLLGDTPVDIEFFKNSFWMGQLLHPTVTQSLEHPCMIQLKLSILSSDIKHTKNLLIEKMPEILKTSVVYENGKLVNAVTEGIEPYAEIYLQETTFEGLDLEQNLKYIPVPNYVVIDVGADIANIVLSEKIKKYYDHSLIGISKRMNIQTYLKQHSLMIQEKVLHHNMSGYCKIHYFGSMNESLTYDNIIRLEELRIAGLTSTDKKDKNKKSISERSLYSDLYKFRSTIASSKHVNYRLFSAVGNINNKPSKSDYKAYKSYINDSEHLFLQTWAEKRRWNAFVRAEGFRTPTTQQVFSIFLETYERLKEKDIRKALRIHEILYGEATGSKRLYDLHTCLLELSSANGPLHGSAISPPKLPADELIKWEKKIIGQFTKECIEASETAKKELCDKYPMFYQYLDYLGRDLYREHSNFDTLDVLSLLSGAASNPKDDYKRYDTNHILKYVDKYLE